jgi:DNA-binding NarL/FixJ family response regulator
VYAGETVLNGQAARKVFSRLSSAGPAVSGKSSQRLQQRELEILRQAARGLSNKGIASGLEVSERTVQTHLMNIFRKLGVGSRTEAVLRALREGWITPDDLP